MWLEEERGEVLAAPHDASSSPDQPGLPFTPGLAFLPSFHVYLPCRLCSSQGCQGASGWEPWVWPLRKGPLEVSCSLC